MSPYGVTRLQWVNCPMIFQPQHLTSQLISPGTKWPPFWQTTISEAFSWMKMIEFLFQFHWNLFPGVKLTINQHWFRWWLGTEQVISHYLNQCWPNSWTHICNTRGRWVERVSDSLVLSLVLYSYNFIVKSFIPIHWQPMYCIMIEMYREGKD